MNFVCVYHWQGTQSAVVITSIHPPVASSRACCLRALVTALADRARVAQKEWALTTFAERKRVLGCLQRYILDHQEDIARVASRDSGKTRKRLRSRLFLSFLRVLLWKTGMILLGRLFKPRGRQVNISAL